jgi:hypothetical protein
MRTRQHAKSCHASSDLHLRIRLFASLTDNTSASRSKRDAVVDSTVLQYIRLHTHG